LKADISFVNKADISLFYNILLPIKGFLSFFKRLNIKKVYAILFAMKLLIKILLFCYILIIAVPNLFASEIKNRNEYLWDVRGDDGDIYLSCISLDKKIKPADIHASIFSEIQFNTKTSEWEKLLLGFEGKKSFWKYLWFGQSIQLISGQILDYLKIKHSDIAIDTTTKLGLKFPLKKNFFMLIYQTLSFNINSGRDEYCESIIEASYNPNQSISIGIGWRHTDRIHSFDSDYITSSITLGF